MNISKYKEYFLLDVSKNQKISSHVETVWQLKLLFHSNSKGFLINSGRSRFSLFTYPLSKGKTLYEVINDFSRYFGIKILRIKYLSNFKSEKSEYALAENIAIIVDIKNNDLDIPLEHDWVHNVNEIPKILKSIDKKILLKAFKNITHLKKIQITETQPRWRHFFHKKIISRLFYYLSSNRIRSKIFKLIEKCKIKPRENHKIIDISCGYDDLLFQIAEKFQNSKIVGNDLIWQPLISSSRKKKYKNIILTNENIIAEDFLSEDKYDLIICKNTLHHIKKSHVGKLLSKLAKAGKNVIIVEIENPLNYSFLSFIWNFYYKHFLKDNEREFLANYEFKQVIKRNCYENLVSFDSIKTIKGNYMVALVQQRDLNIQI